MLMRLGNELRSGTFWDALRLVCERERVHGYAVLGSSRLHLWEIFGQPAVVFDCLVRIRSLGKLGICAEQTRICV